jgi:RNA polymerase sigma-70 factor (ECF subfamily)
MTDPPGPNQSGVVDPAALLEPSEPPDFRLIYEAEFGYVWNTLKRIGVQERDLEDLCHDVFVAFYRGLHTFDPARPVKPWLFGIAFRVASDHRRRAHNRLEVSGAREVADVAPAADEQVAARQDRSLVARALERLDPDKRAVFVMHEIDGCSMPEIAQVVSAPLNTLYSRLRLARAEFAAAIRAERGSK